MRRNILVSNWIRIGDSGVNGQTGRSGRKPKNLKPPTLKGKISLMITALQLRERMQENPFRPFRITLSDGRSFKIPNHDAAFVKRNAIEVGVGLDSNSFAEKYVECALLHITSVEDSLQAA
jgi:hypothetical protein